MFGKIVEEKLLPYIKEGLGSSLFTIIETPANSDDIENEIVYMIEDPKMKHRPTISPWRLFITIRQNTKGTIAIHYDLELSIPRAVPLAHIIAALESPHLNTPSLTIPNGAYQLTLSKSVSPESARHQTKGTLTIIQQTYKTQTIPENFPNLVNNLKEFD